MRIYLNNDDCPNSRDRDAAVRIVEDIVLNDVVTKGTFVIEGYSAARRIARALTVARADERRLGFETPMPMRGLAPASGSPVVLARWPSLRPLYHWLTVDGVRFQSYRADAHRTPLISEDGRIRIEQHGDFWVAQVDGAEVISCGLVRRFDNEIEAVRAALAKVQ